MNTSKAVNIIWNLYCYCSTFLKAPDIEQVLFSKLTWAQISYINISQRNGVIGGINESSCARTRERYLKRDKFSRVWPSIAWTNHVLSLTSWLESPGLDNWFFSWVQYREPVIRCQQTYLRDVVGAEKDTHSFENKQIIWMGSGLSLGRISQGDLMCAFG